MSEDSLFDIETEELVKLVQKVNAQKYQLEHALEQRQTVFTVSIFGSARVSEGDPLYKEIRNLSFALSKMGMNIVTGGGPGIMQAANEGAKMASPDKINSFGVNIRLPHEQHPNNFLDQSDTHQLFSTRLDQFIRLSHMFIAAPGGIGTLLELLYMWQLNQVGMMQKKRIILFRQAEYWQGLVDWIGSKMVEEGFVNPEDMKLIIPADTIGEVLYNAEHALDEFEASKISQDP